MTLTITSLDLFAAADGSLDASPGIGLWLWAAAFVVVALAGVVTAAKGRWGWLTAGLFTGGILWLYSAWLPRHPHRASWRRPGRRQNSA